MTEIELPTAGGCMRPWIWPNGKLYVERCAIADLRVGDIAVWFDGKSLISHRVVQLAEDSLATRADSSASVDAPVGPSQLLGRAVRFSKGPISYRLDGRAIALLSRVAQKPWARLLDAARYGRARLARVSWLRDAAAAASDKPGRRWPRTRRRA